MKTHDNHKGRSPMQAGDNTLQGRVLEFFQRNPGEVLSYDDAAVKFGVTRTQIKSCVQVLRAKGFAVGVQFLIGWFPEQSQPRART